MVRYKRFDVYLVSLDPTQGTEIKKTRPCIIISPDEINEFLQTVIVAPMSTKTHNYPFRINIEYDGKQGQVILDQIRTVDKSRLIKCLGSVKPKVTQQISKILLEMFTI